MTHYSYGSGMPGCLYEAAKRERDTAAEACPHWDYDSPGDCGAECCYRLDDARRRLCRALERIQEARS